MMTIKCSITDAENDASWDTYFWRPSLGLQYRYWDSCTLLPKNSCGVWATVRKESSVFFSLQVSDWWSNYSLKWLNITSSPVFMSNSLVKQTFMITVLQPPAVWIIRESNTNRKNTCRCIFFFTLRYAICRLDMLLFYLQNVVLILSRVSVFISWQ